MRSSARYAILAVPFLLLFAVLGACGGGGNDDDTNANTDTTPTATSFIGAITINPTALGGIDTTPGAPNDGSGSGDGDGSAGDGTSPTASSGQPGNPSSGNPDTVQPTLDPDQMARATREAEHAADDAAEATASAREHANDPG
jgi:hypothetical protein